MPHPYFALAMALLLGAAFAAMDERPPRERLYAAVRVLAGCLLAVIGGGWLMRLIHG